jgi:hypothetical protein
VTQDQWLDNEDDKKCEKSEEEKEREEGLEGEGEDDVRFGNNEYNDLKSPFLDSDFLFISWLLSSTLYDPNTDFIIFNKNDLYLP